MLLLIQDAQIVPALERLIDGARKSILLVQYQFKVNIHPRAPMRRILDALLRAADRAVKITILLNNSDRPNQPGTNHGNVKGALRHPAISIFEKGGRQILHTKLLVVDDARILVGSHNLTDRSFGGSRNMTILTDDATAVHEAARTARALIARAVNA